MKLFHFLTLPVKHSFLLYKKLYPLLGVNFDNLSLRQYCERYIIEEFNTASIIRDVTKWNIAHVFMSHLQPNALFETLIMMSFLW